MAERFLLLVEGSEDAHVLHHLRKRHQIPEETFTIRPSKDDGGIDALLGTLPTQLKANDLERLGIVVDADTDLDARWAAVRNILLQAGGVDIPAAPDPGGTIVTIERPDRTLRVGVWIMPDNVIRGMLEDFVTCLVPANDTLWPRAVNCVVQIPESERRFSPAHQAKAHIHTWLAWQEEPGRPMGQAITKRYLDAEAESAQRFIAWIRRLFD